jgi:hypothetical protein
MADIHSGVSENFTAVTIGLADQILIELTVAINHRYPLQIICHSVFSNPPYGFSQSLVPPASYLEVRAQSFNLILKCLQNLNTNKLG